ncbi:putative O-methyltransferase [Talaromyces proteolyticus]|uniref:O-methyltransferase n=1 Tax=Talaromyces proteolyticus TaxID=1131652 RepID=A0AAD4L051_9EURO|nr:putative O-methyltransferase [Talaromyces proteolyticus]KAH8700469.1 putative O-methyltransferase [Talaromyces proteolyticus]
MATSLSDLTTTVESALSSLPPSDKIEDAERMRLLGIINQLQTALEPPLLSIQRLCFSHYGIVAVRVAQGMGVFDSFVEAQGTEMTLAELSSKTKGDEALLKRIMRYLCAHHIFKETTQNTYQPLPLAMIFGTGSVPGDMIKHFHTNLQVTAKMFEYFEKNGYKNPEDLNDAPFQLAYNTRDTYFEWLQKNPTEQQVFNSVMTESLQYCGKDWFNIYPVPEKLKCSPSRVLLVDIGGGVGHDIIAFRKQFPELPGKLVVQDLAHVIDDIQEPLPDSITAVAHNMFDPQPFRGAKSYYMRTVLHDFPDRQVVAALSRIREAMAEDSILLIHEHTVPEGPNMPPLAATLDLHMMEIFSSLERTEEQWIALLEKAEFKVNKIWKDQSNAHHTALFEATL